MTQDILHCIVNHKTNFEADSGHHKNILFDCKCPELNFYIHNVMGKSVLDSQLH